MESELKQFFYTAETDIEKQVLRKLLAKQGIYPCPPSSLKYFDDFYIEGFEYFQEFAQKTLHLDFSAYKGADSYFKNEEIKNFIQAILAVQKRRCITWNSPFDENALQDWYLTLLSSFIQGQCSLKEINSRMFFFSKSSVPPSLSLEASKIEDLSGEKQEKSIESPRIIVRLIKNVYDDRKNSMDQLLEYMASLSSQEPFKYQIGLLLDKEQAMIFWREISQKDPSRDKENSALFMLDWPIQNIFNFVEAITEEKDTESKKSFLYVDSDSDSHKFENFYGLYELFVFCKCLSHILCMKNS